VRAAAVDQSSTNPDLRYAPRAADPQPAPASRNVRVT
jgi:hypothetical protein